MGAVIHVFTLRGVPVFMSVWYLLLILYVGYTTQSVPHAIVIVAVITISVLIHEFGHALVARRLSLAPRVVIHAFGGFCIHTPARTLKQEAWISAAGPLLQLAAGVVVLVLFHVLGSVAPEFLLLGHIDGYIPLMYFFLDVFGTFSIVWSLLNLLPMFPLDGGNLFRLFLTARTKRGAAWAERTTYQVGLAVAVIAGVIGASMDYTIAAFLAFFMAWENFNRLSLPSAAGGVAKRAKTGEFSKALFGEAEAALAQGDWREAARLAHQLRDQADVRGKAMKRAWEIIALAYTELGEWAEALDYMSHAPDTEAIRQARARCEAALAEAAKEA